MAPADLEDIQKGWKVYAGADPIGKVEDIGAGELVVTNGVLMRHTYHVPAEYIEDATDGVVDLNVDRETLERAQPHP